MSGALDLPATLAALIELVGKPVSVNVTTRDGIDLFDLVGELRRAADMGEGRGMFLDLGPSGAVTLDEQRFVAGERFDCGTVCIAHRHHAIRLAPLVAA